MMTRRWSRTVLAGGSALALLAGACSGSDDDGGSEAGDVSVPVEPEDVPTGEPIRVMSIGSWTLPDGTEDAAGPGGAVARAEYLNTHGGINGRPLEVIVCDTNTDPNQAERCARDAVEQEVAAVVGLAIAQTEEPRVFPILEAAGIPLVGALGQGALALTSEISFPVGSANPGLFGGLPQVLADQVGAETIGVVMSDIGPAVPYFTGFIEAGLEVAGAEMAGEVVTVPVDAADYSPYVAEATAEDPDALIVFIVSTTAGNFIQGLRQTGYQGAVATASGLVTSDVLEQLGSGATDVYAFSSFAVGDDVPGYQSYRADLAALDEDLVEGERSINSWVATWLFEQVASELETVDAASVLAAMGTLDGVDLGGIVPPYSTQEPVQGLPGITRIFNPYGVALQAEDGAWHQPSPDFVDAFTGEVEAPPGG